MLTMKVMTGGVVVEYMLQGWLEGDIGCPSKTDFPPALPDSSLSLAAASLRFVPPFCPSVTQCLNRGWGTSVAALRCPSR
jgi:hypothetical protein